MATLNQIKTDMQFSVFKTVVNTGLCIGTYASSVLPLNKDYAMGFQIMFGLPLGVAGAAIGAQSLKKLFQDGYYQGNYTPIDESSYRYKCFYKTLRVTEQVSAVCAIASAFLPIACLVSNK